MEAYSLLIIVVGIYLILLQNFFEIHMRTDDKYILKKTSEDIEEELEGKRKKTKFIFCDHFYFMYVSFIHQG